MLTLYGPDCEANSLLDRRCHLSRHYLNSVDAVVEMRLND